MYVSYINIRTNITSLITEEVRGCKGETSAEALRESAIRVDAGLCVIYIL